MTEYKDLWFESNDGLKLFARDYSGPGGVVQPPLLCMHGLTRNSADFAGLAAHLAPQRRLLCVDQRGRGRSDYDPVVANYTPATYVQDMFNLLDQQRIERVILVGTSMGGLMAFMMGVMQPQRIAAMVINDIGPEVDPAGLARIKAYVGKSAPVSTWEQAVEQQRAINGLAFPDFSDAQWLAFTQGLYRDEDGVPVLAYDPAIAQPIADEQANAVPPDLWPMFERLDTIPMLVLRGESSDILSRACVERMQHSHPGLVHVEIPRRGHAPMLDEPEALAAIDTFLGEVR